MHVWDEYDVFGDSIYSQNVKDRIDDERGIIEKEKKTWFTELFKSRRKTDFLDLFDLLLQNELKIRIQGLKKFLLQDLL